MNEHFNVYFVVFGVDRFRPAELYRACKNKFDTISDARRYAARFTNAYIFKAHFFTGADVPEIRQVI